MAVDDIENEITVLTKTHQETRDRLKSLKASKTDLRKRKSSSKAESNSSGRIRTTATSSAKVKKVVIAAKVGSKKCMLPFVDFFELSFNLFDCNTSRTQGKKSFVIIVDQQLDYQPSCCRYVANFRP